MPILQWLNRDESIAAAGKAAYRILEDDPSLSYGDDSPNLLVHGDNLEALKALLPYYAGQVKCIYIDPPYNTRSAFEHYDDNLEHSTWLQMMYPRLELLRDFLREDGSIWVSIDDSESAYMRVILDEVFGRNNFVACNVWQKRYSRENREAIGDAHEYIYVYTRNIDLFKKARNKLPLGAKQLAVYKNPNKHPKGPWRSVSLSAQGFRPNQMYSIVTPSGKAYVPPEGSCWKVIESEYQRLLKEDRIYFGKNWDAVPSRIQFLEDIDGIVPWTWWPHEEAGHTDEAKREVQALFGKTDTFETPKPERLIQRILHIATNPGDLVLDSFLGSGTTAAVAHKMGRRWIGVEIGNHAISCCAPRLQKVVDGEQGGISKAVKWQGGGGFRFARLGDTVFDELGQINPAIRFPALAAHVWFSETGEPYRGKADSALIGVHGGTAYYLLYNGILGDKRPAGGNVLTTKVLAELPAYDGPKVIFGEASRIGAPRMAELGISFRQTPYDIKSR